MLDCVIHRQSIELKERRILPIESNLSLLLGFSTIDYL